MKRRRVDVDSTDSDRPFGGSTDRQANDQTADQIGGSRLP
jgi:hypothetical protein